MSTDTTWQTNSPSSEATEQLGLRLGKVLKGGEVIDLISDLGGGKTTFVRGLARGAGSPDKVASPSFTISKIYDCPKFTIHHFDFYRLSHPGIMADELSEIILDPKIVVVIEWASIVRHVLPKSRLTIEFKVSSVDGRQLTCTAPTELGYLQEALS